MFFVILTRATEGLVMKGGMGFVGLPGFMNRMSLSHFILELCVSINEDVEIVLLDDFPHFSHAE